MILIIDNYDSFTYNLVHLVGAHTDALKVVRNDAITVDEARDLNPSGVLISPGPGRPEDAGITRAIIRELGADIPILGVCLGHQAIGEVFGGRITNAPELMHGKTSTIQHDAATVFEGLPQDFHATRYHSLVVSPESIPDELIVSARTSDGTVMGMRHRSLPIEGIQFHPESILTDVGPKIITNWLVRYTGLTVSVDAASA